MLRTHLTDSKQEAAVIEAIQRRFAAIRARDYFDAPGRQEAAAAVASCEEALAEFESEALSAELDESMPGSRPGLHAVEGGND